MLEWKCLGLLDLLGRFEWHIVDASSGGNL